MGWKNWPSWVKGGIITGLITGFLLFILNWIIKSIQISYIRHKVFPGFLVCAENFGIIGDGIPRWKGIFEGCPIDFLIIDFLFFLLFLFVSVIVWMIIELLMSKIKSLAVYYSIKGGLVGILIGSLIIIYTNDLINLGLGRIYITLYAIERAGILFILSLGLVGISIGFIISKIKSSRKKKT